MAKLTLNDITGGYQTATAYNANNALIETALENTLSRDGSTPNTMSAELDMNSNDINNCVNLINTGNLGTASQTPASSGATGVTGTITWDSSYIYVCVATNTWKRIALATW